jgi:hypothetical protein
MEPEDGSYFTTKIHGHHLVTAAQTAESSFEFVNSCSLVSIRRFSAAWIRLRANGEKNRNIQQQINIRQFKNPTSNTQYPTSREARRTNQPSK